MSVLATPDENPVASIATHRELLRFMLEIWWAMQGLNLRPHPCEGCALPLS